MALLVQKYGGSSIPSLDRIKAVAQRIAAAHHAGHDVVVVMSAMGGTTDQLLTDAQNITAAPPPRELDALLATGEQASNALTAMALNALGTEACSFTGWQAGILTSPAHGSADIIDVHPYRVRNALDRGVIPLVAGFQGLIYGGVDVTTLGRGGSDTTAVALAAALKADACEIYTDVSGVYTADPKIVPEARPLACLTHQHMREMAAGGAKVLALSSVEYAQKHGVTLHVRSSYNHCPGTIVSDEFFDATYAQQSPTVIAITHNPHNPKITLPGRPEPAPATLRLHATTSTAAGRSTPRSYPLHTGHGDVPYDECTATVSLIGSGLCAHPETLATLRRTLTRAGIPFTPMTTTDTRITLMCSPSYLADTVRALHKAFLTHTPQPPVPRHNGQLTLQP
ncbi:aspartate kinase [Streptomyces sp. NPDC057582]|uniref:aspartate kinase n=1 Tax=Streptomyces sp. NPDC057582 TaxID=3346174 RepID=UPI0036A659F3